MTTQRENPDNPGIFVRLFDEDDYEVKWMDGNEIIELANEEESNGGETITDYLERKHVEGYAREMYSPLGKFEGVTVLRRLTLYEAVHYLGRDAQICAFLRPRMQAARFMEGLKKSKYPTEHIIADEVHQFLCHFDEEPELQISKSGLYRQLEEQLLNITTK